MLAGLDEVSYGAAVGDLVAAAVILPASADAEGPVVAGLTDSKKLSSRRRTALRDQIVAKCPYGIGVASCTEIDRDGLGACHKRVFHRALDDLEARFGIVPSELIVDGVVFAPWRNVPHRCEPKADLTHACVSAASIVAKVHRDETIARLCEDDVSVPSLDARFDLRSNKGYLTPTHIAGLRLHGMSEVHRTSYKVKALEPAG